ncbi:MAG: pilus assembly protein N-terminal domain-containing protein [Beijerinckiaceae bacterium]|nr:pilus assembly protein N-terminal domain-containing protein [Beijerinckiaceae bacterium]
MVRGKTGIRACLGILLAIVGVVGAATDAWSLEKTISVVIDQAHLVDLPPGTATLIIGNPTIADVTMIGNRSSLMVLTPKAFGETNFIALDSNGKPLSESIIQVVAGSETLIVQRGMERQSYACAPKCQATEKLGDDNKFFTDTVQQAKAYNSSATSSAPPVSGSVISAPH